MSLLAMYPVQSMRKYVCDRLTAAAQEILGAFEKRLAEYEAEIARQQRMLDTVFVPEAKLPATDLKKLLNPEDNNLEDESKRLPNTLQIKDELEEVCISQQQEESRVSRMTQTPVSCGLKHPIDPNKESGANEKPSTNPSFNEDTELKSAVLGSHPSEAENQDGSAGEAQDSKSIQHIETASNQSISRPSTTSPSNEERLDEDTFIDACVEKMLHDMSFDVDVSANLITDSSHHSGFEAETTSISGLIGLEKGNDKSATQTESQNWGNITSANRNEPRKSWMDVMDDKSTSTQTVKPAAEEMIHQPPRPQAQILTETNNESHYRGRVVCEDKDLTEKKMTEPSFVEKEVSTESRGHGKLMPNEHIEDYEPVLREDFQEMRCMIGKNSSSSATGAELMPPNAVTAHALKERLCEENASLCRSAESFWPQKEISGDTKATCSTPLESMMDTSSDLTQNKKATSEEMGISHIGLKPTCDKTHSSEMQSKTLKSEKMAESTETLKNKGLQGKNQSSYCKSKHKSSDKSLASSRKNTSKSEEFKSENLAQKGNKRLTEDDISDSAQKKKRQEGETEGPTHDGHVEESSAPTQNSDLSAGWSDESASSDTGEAAENPYQCDMCGKVMSNFKNYKFHMKSHTVEKTFKCDTCGKMFRESWDLNKHMVIHSAEKPYKCDVCGNGFNRRYNLDLHARVHTGEKPYVCSTCGKNFSSCVNMKKHMRIHTGEKPYTCKDCGKEFADSSAFKNHLRVHTGEKPFKCSYCKRKFATRTTLKRHIRTHTGEKPYKCTMCDKRFGHRTDLKGHIRMHTGEKPYKCTMCEEQFSNWSKLNKHKRVHASEARSPPE